MKKKTLITHITSEKVRFLGYEIQKAHNNTVVTRSKNGQKKRAINGGLKLLVPTDVINMKLKKFMKNGILYMFLKGR